jgi:hypothetical protein
MHASKCNATTVIGNTEYDLKPFMALIAKILSRRKSPLYGILRD